MPNFSTDEPIRVFGAVLNSQSLWVLGIGAVLVVALVLFFTRTLIGKGHPGDLHEQGTPPGWWGSGPRWC